MTAPVLASSAEALPPEKTKSLPRSTSRGRVVNGTACRQTTLIDPAPTPGSCAPAGSASATNDRTLLRIKRVNRAILPMLRPTAYQATDHAAQLRLEHHARHLVDDVPPRVEEHRCWHAPHVVVPQCGGIRCVRSGVMNAELGQQAAPAIVTAQSREGADVHADKPDLAFELIGDPLESGHLSAARRAVAGPEVEHDRLPVLEHALESGLLSTEDRLTLICHECETLDISGCCRGRTSGEQQ